MACEGKAGADDPAAGEVVSVVLLAAATIVLAAMVGSVLLTVANSTDDRPVAGANVAFNTEGDRISVTYAATRTGHARLDVAVYDRTDGGSLAGRATLERVGEKTTFGSLADGHRYVVRVVAVTDGRQVVVGNDVGVV